MKVDKVITEDEAALYDRQIRLWGIDAQRKLLSCRILIIKMKGLGAEIAKNLVLGGIGSLTLMDSEFVTEEDFKFNFLLPHSSLGKNRAESCVESLQTLNPMVKISADKSETQSKDETYFSEKNFDIICALCDDYDDLKRLNEYCRKNNVLFLCGRVFGLNGYAFVDFNDYNYISEAPKIIEDSGEKKKNTSTTTNASNTVDNSNESDKLVFIEKNIKFKSYAEFLEGFKVLLENMSPPKIKRLSKTYFLLLFLNVFYETHNKSFSHLNEEDKKAMIEIKKSLFEKYKIDDSVFPDMLILEKSFDEIVAVNAILGGIIGQEVVKAISKKNEPIENTFFFDGEKMNGDVLKI